MGEAKKVALEKVGSTSVPIGNDVSNDFIVIQPLHLVVVLA